MLLQTIFIFQYHGARENKARVDTYGIYYQNDMFKYVQTVCKVKIMTLFRGDKNRSMYSEGSTSLSD